MEKDERFTHIITDPKFRRIPKSERKVKIDKRFQSMFKDKKFKVKYTTDKRGRPISHTSNEDLKRYYELSSAEESESHSEEENAEADNSNKETEVGKYVRPLPKSEVSGQNEVSVNQLHVKHKSDKKIPLKTKQKLKNLNIDYARGESKLLSESSSDSEESESDESEEVVEHAWGELDKDAEKTDEISNRLAVCNMDWDRIRATDLMVLFSSFLPAGGLIHSVTIYPSEFGLKRMQEEEVKGPIELTETKNELENGEDQETSEGSKYHMEKLRQYQLNRLKYYYAVVVCDSPNTANKIYTECDGLEYESSATKIDLRFISDDIVFDQTPKEVCDKLPEQGKYQPRFFTTTALQQAKVDLTWDETDPNRIEITEKLRSGNSDIPVEDLQNYLASSTEDEDTETEEEKENEDDNKDEDNNPIEKYKLLLQEIEKKEEEKKNRDIEMEVTWGIDLKEKTEKLVKEKMAQKEEKTPFEEYLEKRKEKRKAKREKAKQKSKDSQSDNDSEDSISVDMSDPYFAEEFQSGEFKKKERKKTKSINVNDESDEKKKAELELLLLNNNDSKKHFSLKKLQENEKLGNKKRKKKQTDEEEDKEIEEDNFQLNVNDERFSALYSSHHFNIDPTDPHFKRTKAMELLVNEKLKRRNNEVELDSDNKKTKTDKLGLELNMLVKSVKRKANMFNRKK